MVAVVGYNGKQNSRQNINLSELLIEFRPLSLEQDRRWRMPSLWQGIFGRQGFSHFQCLLETILLYFEHEIMGNVS